MHDLARGDAEFIVAIGQVVAGGGQDMHVAYVPPLNFVTRPCHEISHTEKFGLAWAGTC